MAKRKAAKSAKGKPKPATPKLETALVWAALANISQKMAEKTEVGLALGDYKVHGTMRAEVLLGPRRKPKLIEVVLSADLDVDPPQPYSALPREKPLLAGLLSTVSKRAAKEIVEALAAVDFTALTQEHLDYAGQLLATRSEQQPGKKLRVGVTHQLDEVAA